MKPDSPVRWSLSHCPALLPPWQSVLLAAAAVAVAMWLVVAPWVAAQEYDDQAWRIAQELQCPICQGQSVAESNSQLAIQMRALIREKLAEGETREAILQYFVERYGDNVLMAPRFGGFNSVVWVMPYLGLLAAVLFLIWMVRRRSDRERLIADGQAEMTPYLAEVDRTVERLRDEPVR